MTEDDFVINEPV